MREAAASTVFTMLYIGAVEGSGIWTAPKQIVRMTDEQAGLHNEAEQPELRDGLDETGI